MEVDFMGPGQERDKEYVFFFPCWFLRESITTGNIFPGSEPKASFEGQVVRWVCWGVDLRQVELDFNYGAKTEKEHFFKKSRAGF